MPVHVSIRCGLFGAAFTDPQAATTSAKIPGLNFPLIIVRESHHRVAAHNRMAEMSRSGRASNRAAVNEIGRDDIFDRDTD